MLAIITAAIFSLLSFILPRTAASIYSLIMLPLILFVGFILGLQVASTYEKDLKKSFLFLSLFLIIYMLINIDALWPPLYSVLGRSLIFLVLFLQVVNYAMLIVSCIYTLRVMEARRMHKYGWVIFGMLFDICVYIVFYGIPAMMGGIPANPAVAVSSMMIRIFDMSIVLMLVPVLVLYLQNSRSKAQESVTFTLIMCGIIISLLSTYIIEFATGMPPYKAAEAGLLNPPYLFGYIIIAIGLYAHRKYDEWGYKMIEKALG